MTLWSLKSVRILVIDDIAEIRTAIRGLLTTYGAIDITLARDGEEAISWLESSRFDLVLCDYNLGKGRDGQQVLEEAKYCDLLPHSTVFVMVTAESSPDMVMGTLEYQPDAYLSKPLTQAVLRTRLRKLLAQRDRFSEIHEALDANNRQRAIALCDRELEQGSAHRMTLLKLKSDLLFKTEDYAALQELCEDVLEERDIPWAAFALGKVFYHQEKFELAKESFLEVIDLNDSFILAYDWLAKTYQALDEPDKAEQALVIGVDKSPKSLPRQRSLADVATKNGNWAIAEKARRQAVRVGKHSVLKEPRDYTSLAKVLLKRNNRTEPVEVLDSIKNEFRNDASAQLEAYVAKGSVFKELGDDERSAEAVGEALSLFTSFGGNVSSDVAMELAENSLAHAKRDQADSVVKQVVSNHHDDARVLAQVTKIYEGAGLSQEGQSIVTSIRDEIADMNNRGIKLLKEGKIEESIELLSNSLKSMPKNPIVNLNAAYALTLYMKQSGTTRRRLAQAMSYLEVARESNGQDDGYRKVMALCQELATTRRAS